MIDVVIMVQRSKVSVYHFFSSVLRHKEEFAENVCIIFLSPVIDSSQCSKDCMNKRSVLCCVL